MKSGVTFGEKHSLDDWGLIFSTKSISTAEPQTIFVNIPGRNGAVDMTEVLTNNVKYNDREISITFYTKKDASHYQAIMSEIQNYLQGQRMKIIFDDDIAFYWLGRPKLDELSCDGSLGLIVISAIVEPYKYTVQSSAEDWLWDPFDFEQSVIREFSNIVVNGSKEIVIDEIYKYTNPIIISNADMTVEFDNESYDIEEGSQVMYDIVLTEGENKLTFSGNGTISINIVGGSL